MLRVGVAGIHFVTINAIRNTMAMQTVGSLCLVMFIGAVHSLNVTTNKIVRQHLQQHRNHYSLHNYCANLNYLRCILKWYEKSQKDTVTYRLRKLWLIYLERARCGQPVTVCVHWNPIKAKVLMCFSSLRWDEKACYRSIKPV